MVQHIMIARPLKRSWRHEDLSKAFPILPPSKRTPSRSLDIGEDTPILKVMDTNSREFSDSCSTSPWTLPESQGPSSEDSRLSSLSSPTSSTISSLSSPRSSTISCVPGTSLELAFAAASPLQLPGTSLEDSTYEFLMGNYDF